MMNKKRILSRNGFTMVEMLIAFAIFILFTALAASTLKDIYDITNKNRKQLEAETDLSLSIRYMTNMLKAAAPSFNNVIGNPDDSGREFFDNIFDVSTAAWSELDSTRTLTLSPQSGRLDFFFLTQSEKQKDQLFYNPVAAYVTPDPVEEMDASAILQYAALNQGNVIKKLAADVWVDGTMILMKVPIPLRYVAVDGSINMNVPPREHIFLGTVAGNDLVQNLFANHIHKTHPVNAVPVATADTFLRTIPSVGGATPVVTLTMVQGWKFTLQKRTGTSIYDLYSYEFKGGSFVNPFLIATKVKDVTFRRDSVGLQIVSVRMTVEK